MNALNKGAGQAGREVLAAMNALNMGAGQAVEKPSGRKIASYRNSLNRSESPGVISQMEIPLSF